MARLLARTLTIACAAALLATPVRAQSGIQFGLGGGATVPLSDFDDFAETGWHGMALLGFQGEDFPVGFRVDGLFQRNGRTDADLDLQTIAGTGNVVYQFPVAPESSFRPYLIGGAGVYNLKSVGDLDESFEGDGRTKFGLNAGAGFNFALGRVGLFLEGRFHNVFDGVSNESSLNMIPVTVGVRFGGEGA